MLSTLTEAAIDAPVGEDEHLAKSAAVNSSPNSEIAAQPSEKRNQESETNAPLTIQPTSDNEHGNGQMTGKYRHCVIVC